MTRVRPRLQAAAAAACAWVVTTALPHGVAVDLARPDAASRIQASPSPPLGAPFASVLQDQGGASFTSLFDGTLNGWIVENTTADNFSVQDGILRVEGPSGWLRSEQQYSDFVLRTEFRFLTPDADSGIFIRAVGASIFMRGWAGDSYQVQVREPTTKSFLPPLGGLFRHGTPPGKTALDQNAVLKAYTGLDEWQQLEIEARRDTLVVRVNGIETTRATIVPRAGWIGIQGETGALEYRSIEIREL